jgi:ketosteroid isomerase-like protein
VSIHPNAALMRAGYQAYTTGDLASLSDHVSDGFAFNFSGRSPLAGVYRGLPEVIKLFTRQFELTRGDFQVVPQKILASFVSEATRGTRRLDAPGINVCHFRDRQTRRILVIHL